MRAEAERLPPARLCMAADYFFTSVMRASNGMMAQALQSSVEVETNATPGDSAVSTAAGPPSGPVTFTLHRIRRPPLTTANGPRCRWLNCADNAMLEPSAIVMARGWGFPIIEPEDSWPSAKRAVGTAPQ